MIDAKFNRRLKEVVDFQQEDYDALDAAMRKCSTWLPGHDQLSAINARAPDPEELKVDIDTLEDWVKDIRRRRR